MIPKKNIENIIRNFKNLELELSSGKIDKKDKQHLIAFAGIANPKHFFEILNKLEIIPDQKIIFKNHQIYESEIAKLKQSDDIIYITTKKLKYISPKNQKEKNDLYPNVRLEFKEIIIINIKKPYAAIEKLSKMDRDRQAFSQKIQSNFFNIFCRSGFYSLASNVDVVHYILKSSKKTWKKGAPLL